MEILDIVIGLIVKAIAAVIGLMLLLFVVGEMFVGHDNVRKFLFWVRGRSEKTGEPTRRFPLP